MNLSNAVYQFAVGLEASAAVGAALKSAMIHADTYEEMNGRGGTKYVRIDDLIGSVPQIVAPGILKEFDAVLDVQFLQIPETQTLAGRLAAREATNQMALDFIEAIYADQRLGTNDCNIIGSCSVRKMNDWRKVANVKTPISVVRLTMNKK
jgi:hypothetical protein